MGVVRGVRIVDRIWASSSTSGESSGGQGIGAPFQMVDVEFTPAAATESVHALDRVDLGSVPGLRQNVTLAARQSVCPQACFASCMHRGDRRSMQRRRPSAWCLGC
jgi:hypothetical protein